MIFRNLLRDLDVYLLKKDKYRLLLPPDLQTGLDPLFGYLESERQTEHQKLVSGLRGRTYTDILHRWRTFIDEADLPDSQNASMPVLPLARGFIRKRWRRVVRRGRDIGAESPDADYHSIRIDCKKLRYLLEFFQSLFLEEPVQFVIGQLKQLQDNLGDFNDLAVQQSELRSFIEKMDGSNPRGVGTAAALGSLIGTLYGQQEKKREAFQRTFKEFNSPKTRDVFKDLFGKST